jgi:hypothetical protein
MIARRRFVINASPLAGPQLAQRRAHVFVRQEFRQILGVEHPCVHNLGSVRVDDLDGLPRAEADGAPPTRR